MAKFQPGQSGNPAGKKRGTLNRKTREINEFFSDLWDDPEWRASARRRIIRGDAPHLEKFGLEHRMGKAKDTLAIDVARPVVVELIGALAPGGNGNWNGNGHQN